MLETYQNQAHRGISLIGKMLQYRHRSLWRTYLDTGGFQKWAAYPWWNVSEMWLILPVNWFSLFRKILLLSCLTCHWHTFTSSPMLQKRQPHRLDCFPPQLTDILGSSNFSLYLFLLLLHILAADKTYSVDKNDSFASSTFLWNCRLLQLTITQALKKW